MGMMVSMGSWGVGTECEEDLVRFFERGGAMSFCASELSEGVLGGSPLRRSVGDDESGLVGGEDLKNSLLGDREDRPEVGDTGFFFRRTVLAPVQALRRASKHARPSFHVASSRAALLRFSFFDRTSARMVSPTVSGLSKRKWQMDAAPSSSSLLSSSEISDSHSRRGRKLYSSSEKTLYVEAVSLLVSLPSSMVRSYAPAGAFC